MSEYIADYLESHGLYLMPFLGVNEWGLEKEYAIKFCNICKDENIAILGGDVYLKEGNIVPVYDNWSTNRATNELEETYIDNSIQRSLEYINKYSESKDYLFVIVI